MSRPLRTAVVRPGGDTGAALRQDWDVLLAAHPDLALGHAPRDAELLLAQGSFDAVRAEAGAALERGVTVVLDIVDGRRADADLADAIADLAARAEAHPGAALVPAFHPRFHPVLRRTAASVLAGDVGLPWGVHAACFGPGEPGAAWAAHLDALRYLLGAEPLRVAALQGEDGPHVASLTFEHGITASLTCGGAPAGDASGRYRVMGAEGVLLADLAELLVHTGGPAARTRPAPLLAGVPALLSHAAEVARGRVAPSPGPRDALAAAVASEAAARAARTGNVTDLGVKDPGVRDTGATGLPHAGQSGAH